MDTSFGAPSISLGGKGLCRLVLGIWEHYLQDLNSSPSKDSNQFIRGLKYTVGFVVLLCTLLVVNCHLPFSSFFLTEAQLSSSFQVSFALPQKEKWTCFTQGLTIRVQKLFWNPLLVKKCSGKWLKPFKGSISHFLRKGKKMGKTQIDPCFILYQKTYIKHCTYLIFLASQPQWCGERKKEMEWER
jgi:hypothetical protein